jgi:hypothetical protein
LERKKYDIILKGENMATTYKTAQVQGTSGLTTYATLYNTSASATAVLSTIAICNTASATATYRVGIMGSAGTPAAANWVVFDSVVAGNDTIFLTVGIALQNSQFVRVSSSANTVTFSAYVSEIT